MASAAPSIGREEAPRTQFERAARLEAFASEARDLAELFRALYYETARVMDATVFLFAVYDEAAKTVQVVRQMDRGVEHPGGSFPLGSGFTSEVIRSGAPRLIRQWATDGPPVRILYGTESEKLVAPQSAVVVPILSGNRVLGVLSAQSYQPEAYGATDLVALGAIAMQAGGAISRIRTTEQRALEHERRALQLEAILATMNDALLIVDASSSGSSSGRKRRAKSPAPWCRWSTRCVPAAASPSGRSSCTRANRASSASAPRCCARRRARRKAASSPFATSRRSAISRGCARTSSAWPGTTCRNRSP